MSGVPIHTGSPISSAKARGSTPEGGSTPSIPASTTVITASNTLGYPSARPGAGAPAPTPTRSQATAVHHGPPPPQPGATPISSSTPVNAKPSLPPPPKVGEMLRSPEYYSPAQATPTKSVQSQPYLQQMTLPSPVASNGQPPASTTSTTFQPSFGSAHSLSFPQRPTPVNLSSVSGGGRDGASLEHPPGYVQNPYASDLTPDQRYATEQASQSGGSQALGYNERRETSNAGFEDEEGVWGMAKKWAKGASDTVGGYVNEMNEKISK